MSIFNKLQIGTELLYSGIYKSYFFGFRLIAIIIGSEIVIDKAAFLIIQAVVELSRIIFDLGLELRIISGSTKNYSEKCIYNYRIINIIIGQTFLLSYLIYLGVDYQIYLTSLTFAFLMMFGFYTARIQEYELYEKIIKNNKLLLGMPPVILILGWEVEEFWLILLSEWLLVLVIVNGFEKQKIKKKLSNKYNYKAIFNESKKFILNSVFSGIYTRLDAVIIAVYSLGTISTEYLYLQRMFSLPLFGSAIFSSILITRISNEKNDKKIVKIWVILLTFLLMAFSGLISVFLKINILFLLLLILTNLKIINSLLTSFLVGLKQIGFISKISFYMFLLSAIVVMSFNGENIIILPIILIVLEIIVLVTNILRVKKLD